MAISVNLAGRLARCVGAVALTLMAASAYAQSSATGSDLTTEELKTAYLGCDRQANAGELDTGGIMQCSIFYEELKRRAFDGDFRSMKAWSDTQGSAVGSAPGRLEEEI